MVMICVMQHAWTPKFQLSGPTVHSYTVIKARIRIKARVRAKIRVRVTARG